MDKTDSKYCLCVYICYNLNHGKISVRQFTDIKSKNYNSNNKKHYINEK